MKIVEFISGLSQICGATSLIYFAVNDSLVPIGQVKLNIDKQAVILVRGAAPITRMELVRKIKLCKKRSGESVTADVFFESESDGFLPANHFRLLRDL